MRFKTITVDELETLPFDDIAYIILKEKGKKMKINDIFKIICDTLNLGESAFENCTSLESVIIPKSVTRKRLLGSKRKSYSWN